MRLTKVLIFAAFCIFLLMAGCSTTNHAPAATMVYHDITGHYNAYFNAHEKMKAVYLAMDKAHKDNYKDILPLYTYSDPKEAKSVTTDLEDIEKRLTLSVQVHKVSNWADDDFLLMGKANYIKGNYDKAQAFFKYTTTEYKNGVDYVKEMKKMGKVAKPTLKKKKTVKPKFVQALDDKGNLVLNKVDQRPSYTLMIHEPARAEALVWLAKTYSAQKKYAEASAIIQFMRSDDKFYTNLDKFVELDEAENFLNQKNYNDAIKPLEKFITMTKKKSERVRPVFILAQLYERKGDFPKASEYYKEVLNNNPTYEMEFYAKIRRAKLGKKSGSSDEIKKLLIAMSKDGKYKDYLDQIYYELGEIVLSENNRADARKDFHKSIAASTKNADQKALSYLQLGRMDFEEEFYVTAKFLYDSTTLNMSKTDTAYEGVQARDKTLGKLVKEINIINTEDSLQRIANMSPSERSKFLKKLLDAKQREADEKQAAKESGKTNTDFIKQNAPGGATATSEEASSFYFYNVTSRSNGYAEFSKKWGNRKLEDNWRRKDKSAVLSENTDDADSAKAKAAAAKDTTTIVKGSEEEKLMAGLPMTPEKMEKSNAKLIDAYYALGTVYKDDLQSYRKAAVAFEELNRRFPKNKLELESFYQLYLINERAKNTAKSDFYKNQILTDYPTSTIAKYLKDPNYLAEVKKKENSLSFYYESAYNDYSSGLYASAEQKCRDVDVQFKENKMRAKFDLLNAMSLAKENRLGDYVESLNKIISKYPGTPEKDQAQSWLNALNKSKLPQVDISKLPKDSLDAVAMDQAPKYIIADTAGQAAFLAKMESAKKDQAKTDAKNAVLNAMAAAKASADSAKNAPKDTSTAKPYKPLSRAERLDSLIKAEKAARNKPAAITNSADTSSGSKSKPAEPVSTRPVFDTDTLTAVYGKSDNAPHYVIVYYLDPEAFNSSAVGSLNTYNSALTDGSKLTAKSSIFDKNNKVLIVRSFKNKDLAMTYVQGLKAKLSDILPGVKPDQYFFGAISQLNYDLLTNSKKINNYMRFYRANYGDQAAGSEATPIAKDTTPVQKPATKPAPKTITKDTVVKTPQPTVKPTAKDTTAKKPQASSKPAVKDTVAKPAPKPTPVVAAKPTFDTDTLTEIYGKSDNAPHNVIIYFLDPAAYNYALTTKVTAFNDDNFPTDKIIVHATELDKDNKLIMIKPFKDKAAAQEYLAKLTAKIADALPGLKPEQYFVGSISALNYSTLLGTKKINNYIRFFRANYK